MGVRELHASQAAVAEDVDGLCCGALGIGEVAQPEEHAGAPLEKHGDASAARPIDRADHRKRRVELRERGGQLAGETQRLRVVRAHVGDRERRGVGGNALRHGAARELRRGAIVAESTVAAREREQHVGAEHAAGAVGRDEVRPCNATVEQAAEGAVVSRAGFVRVGQREEA